MSIIGIAKRTSAWARGLAITSVALAALLLTQHGTVAAAGDYRFEIDGQPVKSGGATLVKIRLIHIPDGKPVSGAIISETRFDMGPEGMATMTAPAKAASASEPGIYQVETQPSMAGKWALTLAAKIQGEAEPVRGTVVIAVPK